MEHEMAVVAHWGTHDDIIRNGISRLDHGINGHAMQRRAMAMRQREDSDDTAAALPGIARQ
ncbi:uncharacterized protein DS421_1g04730 [Arachis hypogaea]|nr:uncharacterized protein DS421_1g04730 [Arachis hypogaea]